VVNGLPLLTASAKAEIDSAPALYNWKRNYLGCWVPLAGCGVSRLTVGPVHVFVSGAACTITHNDFIFAILT